MQSYDSKPLLVYDGDCSFCRMWIKYWRELTGDRIGYAPYQDVLNRYSHIPIADFQKSVQLIQPDGKRTAGAEAVFGSLAIVPGKGWMLWAYRKIPKFAALTEAFYRIVANCRSCFYKITRLLWGRHVERSSFELTSWLFLRTLALIYLIAFLSLWTQIPGLIGSDGILPADQFIDAVETNYGITRYWSLPTLAWLSADTLTLNTIAISGAFFSLFLLVGIASLPISILLWILYLSLFSICRDFTSFQWDIMLLEAGFLAIFLAPTKFFPSIKRILPPSHTSIWLLRTLLFKVTFGSGLVKILSGDTSWRDLTALTYHFETQPLPTTLAWYMHHLPEWLLKIATLGALTIELIVPFLIFLPRRARFLAAGLIGVFQFAIILTGNYTFFNWLTLALCILLLDDQLLTRILPRRIAYHTEQKTRAELPRTRKIAIGVLLTAVIVAYLPIPILKPYRISNLYGAFAVMTRPRMEVVIEGSSDGENWIEYDFKHKPSDILRKPTWTAPHQPRLDWQMWFASLGTYEDNLWFVNLMGRLLEGSPDVLALFSVNPFPEAPPKLIRALYYEYHFTNRETRRETGAWWRRELKDLYFPTVTFDTSFANQN